MATLSHAEADIFYDLKLTGRFVLSAELPRRELSSRRLLIELQTE
jgi:hypothetical protein